MRNLIAVWVAIICLIATLPPAKAQETLSTYDKCKIYEITAAMVMIKRQMGVPLHESLTNPDLYGANDLIMQAYNERIWESPAMRDGVIRQFSTNAGLRCYRAYSKKSK